MSDQCKSCELRGNLSGCHDVDCSIKESWYIREIKHRAYNVGTLCKKRGDALKEIQDMAEKDREFGGVDFVANRLDGNAVLAIIDKALKEEP